MDIRERLIELRNRLLNGEDVDRLELANALSKAAEELSRAQKPG